MAGYVDNAAKVIESDQEAAQSGPSQYVGLSGKEAYSLASAVAVPWDGSGSATATAQLVLQDGATDVLTLVAKDAGVWGNTVEASVEVNAGGPPRCGLRVRAQPVRTLWQRPSLGPWLSTTSTPRRR